MTRSEFLKAVCMTVAIGSAAAGCKTGYTWRPSVPADMRTVSVPTFRNESDVTELGSVMARQVLREVQREGTFKIKPAGDAALEIQGVVKSVTANGVARDRRGFMRQTAYSLSANVEVSIVDKRAGKVLTDNRKYVANTTFTTGDDVSSASRDASGRLADDLARQVVDDLTDLQWKAP